MHVLENEGSHSVFTCTTIGGHPESGEPQEKATAIVVCLTWRSVSPDYTLTPLACELRWSCCCVEISSQSTAHCPLTIVACSKRIDCCGWSDGRGSKRCFVTLYQFCSFVYALHWTAEALNAAPKTTFHCSDYGFSTSVSHRYGFESTKLARGFPRICPVL